MTRSTMIVSLALASCRQGGVKDPQPEPPPAAVHTESAPADDVLSETMHDQFDAVDLIKTAVVDGDLVAAQREVSRLVGQPAPPELTGWQPHVEHMRAIGRELQAATDIGEGAMATARLGAACGSCHLALGHQPRLAPEPEPAAGGDLETRMQRHQWAADRMWEGLILPSDEAWRAGAVVLAEPLPFGDPEPTDTTIIDQLAGEVAALARRAQTARTQDQRAVVFGEALSTCARCHELIRPE